MGNPFGDPLMPGVRDLQPKSLTPEQERQREIDRRLKELADKKKAEEAARQAEIQARLDAVAAKKSERQREIQARLDELDRKQRESRDVPGAIVDIPSNIVTNTKAVAQDIGSQVEADVARNPMDPLGTATRVGGKLVAGAIAGAGEHLADRGLLGTGKDLWDMFVTTPSKALYSAAVWGFDKIGLEGAGSEHPLAKLLQIDTPEARYQATSQGADVAIAAGIAAVTHTAILNGDAALAKSILGLGRNAGRAEMAAAADVVRPGLVAQAIEELGKNGPANFFKRVGAEGFGLGAASTLTSADLRYSDNPALDMLQAGVSSSVIMLGLEGVFAGGRKLTGKKYGNKAIAEELQAQLDFNQKSMFSPAQSKAIAQSMLVSADPIGALTEHLTPDQNYLIDIGDMDATRVQLRYPQNVATFNAGDGTQKVLVINDPTPKGKARLNQFQKWGFYQGMEVDVGGTSMIWDSAPGGTGKKFKVIDVKTGKVLNVPRDQVMRINAPKDYTVESIILDDPTQPDIIERGRKDVTLTEVKTKSLVGVQDILSELPDESKALIESAIHSFYVDKTSAHISNVERLNARGYLMEPQPDGSLKIINTKDPTFSRIIDDAGDIDKIASEFTAPLDQENVIAGINKDVAKKFGENTPAINTNTDNAQSYTLEGASRAKWAKWWDAVHTSAIGRNLFPMHGVVQAIDNRLGTNNALSTALTEIFKADGMSRAARQPFAAEYKAILADFDKLSPNEKLWHRQYLETRTWTDFTQSGVYGVRPTERVIALAKRMQELGPHGARLDANRFIIDELNLRNEYKGKLNSPEFKAEFETKLQNLLDMYGIKEGTPRFEMVKLLTEVRKGRFKEADIYSILTGADLLEFKDRALSRADFVAKKGLSKEFVQVMARWENTTRRLGEFVGIDPDLMIKGYFPRFRKYYPGLTADEIMGVAHMPPKLREFKNALIRTNYFADHELIGDITQVTSRYLDAAIKTKFTAAPLLEFKKQVMNVIDMKSPEGQDMWTGGTKKALRNINEWVDQALNKFENPYDELGRETADKALRRLSGVKEPVRDFSILFMKAMEFKAQGFKIAAGVRDATSIGMVYTYTFGPKRFANLWRVLDIAVKHREKLLESGVTSGLDPTLFADPNKGPVLGGLGKKIPLNEAKGFKEKSQARLYKAAEKLDAGFEKAVDIGFKASLQPQVYSFAHSLAYIEQTQWVSKAIQDFVSGKINAEKLNKRIGLQVFDENVKQSFLAEMNKPTIDVKAATDILARAAGKMVIGEYTRLSAPLLFNNKLGRMAFQFSRWPMWLTSTLGSTITRGGPGAAALRLLYIGGIYAAANEVSNETGLDFKRWVLNPLSFIPGGSPAFQAILKAQEVMDRSGSGQRGAVNELRHMVGFIANPVPIGFMKALEATQRYDEGQPLDVVLMTLFGGSINPDVYKKPKLFD